MERFEGTHSRGSLSQVTRGLERLEGFTFLAEMRKTEKWGCSIIGITTVLEKCPGDFGGIPALGESDWSYSFSLGYLYVSFLWSETSLSPFLPPPGQFRYFMFGSKYNFLQEDFPEYLLFSIHVYFFFFFW